MPFLIRFIHSLTSWKGLLVESLWILSWACSWLVPETLLSSTFSVESPSPHQVFQRDRSDSGMMHVEGIFDDGLDGRPALEWSWVMEAQSSEWKDLEITPNGRRFSVSVRLPAGGWYLLRFRHSQNPEYIVEIHPVGIGEIFVVAGQSNSANHGEVSLAPLSDRVVAKADQHWQLARDPQPGASGRGGSFMPPLGDALAQALGVPIGFVACGIGATSVREWLPQGDTFPEPPTLLGRVRQLEDGRWQSRGEAFEVLMARMRSMGPKGFRAVLWHQGESDANQKDPRCTLPGNLYAQYLKRVIRQSQSEMQWAIPWFVAQASYHVPGDEASTDIRRAQASLWKSGVALQGPDTDALKGPLRESNGQGVHFSREGLHAHAAAWAQCLLPWIQSTLN
ncbi:MAG: hypothetical protein CMI65_05595 [Pedosphaera sp.]|nr:hypothetical protein [Pedosphaera sp.]